MHQIKYRIKADVENFKARKSTTFSCSFLAGNVANLENDNATAANEFRAMLVRGPTLIRPRLELALALQKNGVRQVAKYHYEQVLAANLPDTVKYNVNKQLGDIH